MKNSKKIKWLYRFAVLSFLLLSSVSISYALNTVNTGFRVYKSTVATVDAHGVCKKVNNNSFSDYFVPTKVSNEWSNFRTVADARSLSGVSLSSCALPCTPGSQTFPTPGTYSLVVDVNKESCRFRFTVKAGGGQSGGWGHQGGWGGAVQFDYDPGTTGTFNIFVGGKGQGNSISAYTGGTGYGGGGGASAVRFGDTVLVVSGGGGGAAWGGRGGHGGSLNSAGKQAGGSSPGGGGANNIGGIGRSAGGGYGGSNGARGANGGGTGGYGYPFYFISGGGGAYYHGQPVAGGAGGAGYGGGGGGGGGWPWGGSTGGGGGGGGGYIHSSTYGASVVSGTGSERDGNVTVSWFE